MILDVLKKYNYGIELETARKFTDEQVRYINDKFNAKVVNDGSVDGQEINSPIIPGEEVQKWVEDICKYLASINMTVNKKCGYHLHMSLRYMPQDNIKFFRSLLFNYKHFEPALFAMLPPSRSRGNWCAPVVLSNAEIDKIHNEDSIFKYYYREKRLDEKKKAAIKSHKYNDFRYFNLNLHSWFHRGSIEIRMHSGTLNPIKILNWIYINTCLFEMSSRGEAWKTARPEALSSVTSQLAETVYCLDDSKIIRELKDYIRERTNKFSPEVEEDSLGINAKPVSIKIKRRNLKEGASEWHEVTRTVEFKDLEQMKKELDEFQQTYTRKAGVVDEEYIIGDKTVKSNGDEGSALAIVNTISELARPSLTGAYQAI